MASPALSTFKTRMSAAAAMIGLLSLAGCQLGGEDRDSLPPASGVFAIKGLAQNVSIRRNNLGMPLIESSTSMTRCSPSAMCTPAIALPKWCKLRLLGSGPAGGNRGAGRPGSRPLHARRQPETDRRPAVQGLIAAPETLLRGLRARRQRLPVPLPRQAAG